VDDGFSTLCSTLRSSRLRRTDDYRVTDPSDRGAEQTVPSLGFMAIAVYSDKAREGSKGKTLSLQDKSAERLPHMPLGRFSDAETVLPDASSRSFWLKGSAWDFPDHENAETYVERLVRGGVLVRDPLVDAALRGRPQDLSPQTVRHRFLRATGLTRGRIHQIERAQKAVALLQRGRPISDAVHEVGYYDQPHLSRSLKQWVGRAPAQILLTST
jgi:hypothetical protein